MNKSLTKSKLRHDKLDATMQPSSCIVHMNTAYGYSKGPILLITTHNFFCSWTLWKKQPTNQSHATSYSKTHAHLCCDFDSLGCLQLFMMLVCPLHRAPSKKICSQTHHTQRTDYRSSKACLSHHFLTYQFRNQPNPKINKVHLRTLISTATASRETFKVKPHPISTGN